MLQKENKKKTTVSLVLGSGGARGLAHIGVIRWLEENNFEIKSISGSSIGALIGGVYATGKLEELEEWFLSLKNKEIASLLDFSWKSGGIFKGDRIMNHLISFLEDIQIEDLSLPFTAIATDIVTEKEVWINSGSLFDAIRSSASLPLFFTPIKNGESILIDGGVLNPVPIAPVFNDGSDLIIAVNLGGDVLDNNRKIKNKINKNRNPTKFQFDLKSFIDYFNPKNQESEIKDWNMYQVADKSFDTMQNTIARLKMATYPPDLEIEINRDACGTFEFEKSAEMIKLGYKKTELAYKAHLYKEIQNTKNIKTT